MATTKNSKSKKGLVEKVKKVSSKLQKKATSAVCDTKSTAKKAATSKTATKRKSATKKSR